MAATIFSNIRLSPLNSTESLQQAYEHDARNRGEWTMRIGIGVPNTVPGVDPGTLCDWSRRAEALGFASLATIGRVAYPSYEELVVLAAAAAVTRRIGLFTNVLLGPTRDPVLLAKQTASLDGLSGGRLTLGVGVGSRPEDFEASGAGFHDRGRRWDRNLELLHRAWRGEPVAGSARPVCAPPPAGRVRLLVGGRSDAAVRRTVRWADGWTAGGGGPELAAQMFERVRAAWAEAGRAGTPELRGLSYFALGPRAETGRAYLSDYYGEAGDRMWPAVAREPAALREVVQRFAEMGTDELILSPTIATTDQPELLAEVVL
jgi:alkanesulfonate monooxygenase SsuD/methylene tetrahydromethanopterin reductase-like flavin-dependent oxidoreductase (luciferase family)